ncbi:LeuA family protein [Streptomyces sp. 4F14]|uniref:LeuA family protein n=1 Tax=Streptomyces sp. 4F14 TaxID=3394380 RepID=UPI003A8B2959
MKTIEIFDTTLRDGEQAPGNSMSPQVKVDLFQQIATTGVDNVEAGFPSASPADFEAAAAIAASPRDVTVTAFCRATVSDIDCAVAALGTAPRTQLEVLVTGSEVHAEHKRRMTLAEIERETKEATAYARSLGVTDLSLAFEDSTRGSLDFLHRVVDIGVSAGATTVVIPDTVGQATPESMAALVRAVRSWTGPEVQVSLHCHNDLGLALANSLAGLAAGADVVQTTFCGIGERTGNTAIEELTAVLHYKSAELGVRSRVDPRRMREVCEHVADALGLRIWKHKPVIGRYAFATAAGVHASGIANDPITYEYVEPGLFGRTREVVLSRTSGRANLRMRLTELGMDFTADRLNSMYQRFVSDPDPQRFNDDAAFRELYASAV